MPILRIEKRRVTVEEMKPKRPVPPQGMIEAAMRAIPIAWQEIGLKTEDRFVGPIAHNGASSFCCQVGFVPAC